MTTSRFAAEGKAHGTASLIVALGDELETLSAPARSRMTGLLTKLAEQPHTRHDLAMEVSHIMRTAAPQTNTAAN
ncbi:MAG: hypothetical protein AWU57_182 [Marinobacter sp. T13-3]|nr:MAG: hypothetical protein AWU57_182 [Marinobacter sp. T13-3]